MKYGREHDPIRVMEGKEALLVITRLMEHVSSNPITTAEGFRNAALGNGMFAINPLLNVQSEADIRYLMESTVRKTIAEGRMIDFGYIPNAVIKQESVRARQAFEAGELPHPYESWVGISRWEGGMCGYYFAPHPGEPTWIIGIELYGIAVPDERVPESVVVNDVVSIKVAEGGGTRVSPVPMLDNIRRTPKELQDRGSNLLDPLVTFLRMLADASIPIVDQPEPAKLNKKRVRQGKFPIPAHTRVETRDYVSLLTSPHKSAQNRTSQGGHHASPVAHWRRSHQRHLQSGRVVPVRSSKVNWRETEELHRLFYRVPK